MFTTSRTHRLAAGLALAVLPFTAACGDDDEELAVTPPAAVAQPTTAVESGGQGGAAQEAIEDRIGETVNLNGEVATVISPNAFTVGGDEIGENPILVVSAATSGIAEGDTVKITGEVIRFSVPGVEEDLDLDIVDNEYEDFDGDPAIQATQVTEAAR